MNKVILMGRLTRDPYISYSTGDQTMAIARYTLAVEKRIRRNIGDGKPDADFISCVFFPTFQIRCKENRVGFIVKFLNKILYILRYFTLVIEKVTL